MVRVKCMKPTSSNMRNFRWPDEEDAVFYDDKDIICTIDPPLANGDFCRGEPVLSFKRSTECSKEGLWKPYFKIRLNQCTIFANNFSYDFILLTKRGRLFLIKIKSLVATQTCIWLLRVYRCRGGHIWLLRGYRCRGGWCISKYSQTSSFGVQFIIIIQMNSGFQCKYL